MKLNHLAREHKPGRIVQEFGEAKLFKHPNGRHELIGGTAADIAAANDWVSFFAHEIVFSRPGGRLIQRNDPKPKGLVLRFHPKPAAEP